MHWNHGRHRTSAAPADQPARLVDLALFFQIFRQPGGIEVVGLLLDIHKFGQRAGLRNRLGRGNEGMRHGDHNVARLYSAGRQGKAQSVGPAAHADGIAGFAKGGKISFKVLHRGAADEPRTMQGPVKHFGQLFFKFHMRGHQVEKRNAVLTAVRNTHFEASALFCFFSI